MKRPHKHSTLAKTATLLLAIIAATGWLRADDSYNMQRAAEALGNENYDEALQYARAELAESPDNPWAWLLTGRIFLETGHPGTAICVTDKALRVTPKKDKEMLATLYEFKAYAIEDVNDKSSKALDCLNKAVELCPRDSDALRRRADYLFNLTRFDEANADLKRLLAEVPDNFYAKSCMARNTVYQKRYAEAVKQLDAILATDSTWYQGYAFRGQAKMGLKQWDGAVADAVKALNAGSATARTYYEDLYDSVPALMEKAMLAQAQADTTDATPLYELLARKAYADDRFEDALKYYYKWDSIEPNFYSKVGISRIYTYMGLTQEGIHFAKLAQLADSSEVEAHWYLADAYLEAGDTDSALQEVNQYIALTGDDASGYFTRGLISEVKGKYAEALEDFDFAVVLDESNATYHPLRGIMLQKLGRTSEARSEFERVVACDTANRRRTPIALHFLNRDKEAAAMADSLCNSKGNYDRLWAARYYAISGKTDKALDILEKAVANDYLSKQEISGNYFLKALASEPRMKQIQAKHDARLKELAQRLAKLYQSTTKR